MFEQVNLTVQASSVRIEDKCRVTVLKGYRALARSMKDGACVDGISLGLRKP